MGKPVVIVGGGLVGSLLACRMSKAGFEVEVFEKRHDPRTTHSEGKSINLALSHRGIRALKEAGVFQRIEGDLIPMHGRMMHDPEGHQTIQPYGKEGQFINSVSRHDLNVELMEEAEALGARFHFEHVCESVDFDETKATFSFGDKKIEIKAEVIFGTDGAFSAVRAAMKSSGEFFESIDTISHSYKEIKLPSKDGDFQLEPNYLHIWPRKQFMLIALANPDKSFTCTLFLDSGQMETLTKDSVVPFFQEHFPDFTALMPDLAKQFFGNPTGTLVTVKCSPWNKGRVLLLGDAAHAIVPFYGQGMNAGFEDTRVLMDILNENDFNWDQSIELFAQSRKKDGDAIADLALKNFIEMRDLVADDRFLQRKKIEAQLHDQFPKDWIPQYSMVTFSDIPYSEAMRIGQLQDQVMKTADYTNPELQRLVEKLTSLKSGS